MVKHSVVEKHVLHRKTKHENKSPKAGKGVARNHVFYRFCCMIFRVKKGHVGADLGTFQQAHAAKTIVFTKFLVDFRGVAFAPTNWTKWSKVSVKMA